MNGYELLTKFALLSSAHRSDLPKSGILDQQKHVIIQNASTLDTNSLRYSLSFMHSFEFYDDDDSCSLELIMRVVALLNSK